MDFALDTEQKMLVETARRFVEEELYPYEQEVEVVQLLEQHGDSLPLLRAHPGRGLVEQDKLRLARHDHADLHQLALSMRQFPNQIGDKRVERKTLDDLLDEPEGFGSSMGEPRRKP